MQRGHVRNATLNHPLPFTLLSALWAGMVLGPDRFVLNPIVRVADILSVSHLGSSG
jgi:hypothetical protein